MMAWIDADIEFDSFHWISDTIHLLTNTFDVVQLFSHAVDMDKNENAMTILVMIIQEKNNSIKKNLKIHGIRDLLGLTLYDKMGGLYELNILGGGDHLMALCFIEGIIVKFVFYHY